MRSQQQRIRKRERAQPTRFYRGWNVHDYTPAFVAQLNELPFFGRVEAQEAHAFFNTLLQCMVPHNRRCATALHKMKQRYNATQGGYFDAQLRQLNIVLLLQALFKIVQTADDKSTWQLFAETLIDQGRTCIQGDSHRPAALYLALKRSLDDNDPTEMRSPSAT